MDMYDKPEMEPAESAEPESTEQETALLPKSIFGQKDLKVGSECSFRIVHIYDDEIEVEYVAHKSKKPGGSMMEVDRNIDRMASEA